MKALYKRLRGMPDIVPGSATRWQHVEAALRRVMQGYGHGELRTPLIESTSLFERSLGEATDVVEKEMYSFPDRNGELMTLRPENTAGCVRAAIENGLLQPGAVSRVWYLGPMFRYERPQQGRQRQFTQAGAEVYGAAGPHVEAELILLSARLWRELGINDVLTLEANTLGTAEDRARYRETLVSYCREHADVLDEDSKRRLEKNPLRILDSKNPAMAALIDAAPTLRDSLCEASLEHFDTLCRVLAQNGVKVHENPRLVRGLDYYSHTVFEWTTDQLGAQGTVCAGGRYDGLLEQMGAPGVPGAGWALGMERLLALVEASGTMPEPRLTDVFVMYTGDVDFSVALQLAEAARDALPGAEVVQNPQAGSLKSQFRKADKLGAKVALILGSEEEANATVGVKPLRSGADQFHVARAELAAALPPCLQTECLESERLEGERPEREGSA